MGPKEPVEIMPDEEINSPNNSLLWSVATQTIAPALGGDVQAKFEMTDGRRNLKGILSGFPEDSPHWNEAQNRFQFVDRLLMECLGWEHPFVEVERRDDAGGKADYLLGKPVKAALEAKREAVIFDLLPAAGSTTVRKLRPLIDGCKVLESAVLQVLSYCTLHGAQIAIVCNGPQLLIFQSHIPGVSPLEGETYVFNGFASYDQHFALLWKLLSPEGIAENRAYYQLAHARNPRIPAKAYTAIAEPMGYRYRNEFQENLRTLAELLLESVEEIPEFKDDFYRECYVPLEANNRHLLLSKSIISARYKRVGETGSAPAAFNTSIEDGRVKVDKKIAERSIGSRPIVVIGDVGVGKTSFFENLFSQLSIEDKKQTLFIHLNLGERATLSDSVKSFILQSVPEILKRQYRVDIDTNAFINRVYKAEIEDFEKRPEGRLKKISPVEYERALIAFLVGKTAQRDVHLQASFEYLAKHENKQILLVIDNADQRSFETQQEAFLIAQELASSRNMLVFVALRPSTFFQSKLTGALSGYQNRLLTISPPPADEVLRKRITFAVRVAEGKAAPTALDGIRLNIKSIVHFLNATLRSIRANAQIRTFLSNITGGNTRLVIELITSFCGSPNVDSRRIVRIEEDEGDYQVPLHEFTKHALLGEYSHYNQLSSLVACNIYDISSPDPREHFLAALLIAYLASPLGNQNNDGFVPASGILTEMQRIGFNQDQTRLCIKRLAEKRLIETPHAHYRDIRVSEDALPDQFSFRATSIGLYHIRFWMGAFSFLDATSIDTPIFDEDVRTAVFRVASSFEIKERYARATAFRSYLEKYWHNANFAMSYLDMPQIFAAQQESFDSVNRFIAGGTSRRRR
jgi:GTPase SAR1 family protein